VVAVSLIEVILFVYDCVGKGQTETNSPGRCGLAAGSTPLFSQITCPHRWARSLIAAAADPLRQATDLYIFDQYGKHDYGNASTKMARF
jgi:hypothetical protein